MVQTMLAFMQAFALMPAQPRRLFSPVAKALTPETILSIATNTESTRACAKRFGVAQSTVVRIRNGGLHSGGAKRPPWIRVSDETVEEMRVRHEECGWSFTDCRLFYGLPKSTVCEILKYRKR